MPRAAGESRSGRPDVIVASAGGDRSTWFPTIERLANGELIVVYYDSTSHLGPHGAIALTRSTDDGRTWSSARLLSRMERSASISSACCAQNVTVDLENRTF